VRIERIRTMKLFFGSSIAALVMCASVSAAAQQETPRYHALGMQFDASVPSGLSLGLEARLPYLPWFKLGIAGTMTLAPGVRGSLLFDPFKFVVAPVANFDLGYQSPIKIKGVSGSFTYEDIQGGLAFGKRGGFRFLVLGGMSHLSGDVSGLQNTVTVSDGVTFGNPHFSGWMPNAKLGFVYLF
jgi:hypothetical protein